MDKSLVSKDIDGYKKVSDSKAGLKDVYIIESAGKKYVFSQDNGTGWNWLSEEYVEPLVIEWLQSIKPEISPNIVEYDMEKKLMLTEYVGDKDLSDINHTTENMRQFGNKVGEIYTIGDFDGFGGLKLSAKSVLETQHSDWSETLTLLVEHTDSLPNTSDDKSTKQVIKNQITQVCTDSISPCFSHGDLGPSNVRVGESNNIDSIIDWQNAWVSDGLTEFLYRRMRLFTPFYQSKKASAFTSGFLSTCPESVSNLTDEQVTISFLVALARYCERKIQSNDKSCEFLQKYCRSNHTIPKSKIIDPSTNLESYLE